MEPLNDRAWLDESSGLPLDRPFTPTEARQLGLSRRREGELVRTGLLVRPVRGVLHAGQLADTLALRLSCLRLVVPEDSVVIDRIAGWALGAEMALAPNDHLAPPPVTMCRPPGYRLWQPMADGCERMLAPGDIWEVDGLLLTSPLRTACDLGRRLHREQAYAAMNSLAALRKFTVRELVGELDRFKGHRGVIQLRDLAPEVDHRPQSPPESIIIRRWRDRCPDLPRPEPQVPVDGPWGTYWIDVGVEGIRYGVEYNGPEWHGPKRARRDRTRLRQLRREAGYTIDVLEGQHLFGPTQDLEGIVRRGVAKARLRFGRR